MERMTDFYRMPDIDKVYKASEFLMKANQDEATRSRLMENPRLVLDELSMSIPEGMDVEFHQNTSETFHLVFPPDPNQALADEDLIAVAGGKSASTAGTAGSGSTASCVPICWGSASSAGSAGTAGSAG
jgi:hypothetical protein